MNRGGLEINKKVGELNSFWSHISGFAEICKIRKAAFNSLKNWVEPKGHQGTDLPSNHIFINLLFYIREITY